MKVKIKFKNDKCKVRAIRGWWKIWQYGTILTDKHIKHDPPYNNWSVLFSNSSDINSKKRALWYAATGNNALHEYYEFAATDGIMSPPGGLDVLLPPWGSSGASPMFDEMSANPLTYMSGNLGIWGLASVLGMNTAHPLLGTIMNYLPNFLIIWAPDIVYNHDETVDNAGQSNLMPSDRVKDTYYHEYAHSSHWDVLNDDGYWQANELYVATPPAGYKDGSGNGAGRCAVIEMWGFHIGPTYADHQYVLDHSYSVVGASFTNKNRNRHINRLEERESYRIYAGYIPGGLFHDLIDDNANPILEKVENGNVTNDDITGYQNSSIFSKMTSDVHSPTELRNKLKNNLPPGVTTMDVDDLFSDYGF